ncbi:hypothetical protein JKP88DRAFT_50087 [Tribonema minus]|uniref:Uncharacterized protein n=1 Tax=Tribonema minus TaxID=303371 RepID=A0A835Z0R8_9STRA|nr:hypothetical protein JKP88DRAFT_50087 [Tribonema minus]
MLAEAEAMAPLVDKENWDGVLAKTRGAPLTLLKSAALGLGSVSALARTVSLSLAKAAEVSEAAAEAGVALQQLEDYAFSNRVVFFNMVDKNQVQQLSEETNYKAELDEPRELLADVKQQIQALAALLE